MGVLLRLFCLFWGKASLQQTHAKILPTAVLCCCVQWTQDWLDMINVKSRATKPFWVQKAHGFRVKAPVGRGPRSDRGFSETGRIRFRRVRFQTPNSVSFFGLTEFRGPNSVSSFRPIICVQTRTHRVSRRTHRVCRRTQ